MMFIELLSSKGNLCVNVNKVLFFGESKKGTMVILEDGTVFDLNEPYAEVKKRIAPNMESTEKSFNLPVFS